MLYSRTVFFGDTKNLYSAKNSLGYLKNIQKTANNKSRSVKTKKQDLMCQTTS